MKKNLVTISVITINLNNSKGLELTIGSVINQKFRDFEFIVIDGASIDGSLSVIKRYDDHINYWVSEKDSGIYNAMNKGIARASGEYCIFMNSGDCFNGDDILNRVINIGLDSDIICTCKSDLNRKNISFWDLYDGLPHQSMLFKRSLFQSLGPYNENYMIISDWIFYIQAIIKHNKTIKFSNFIMHTGEPGGISNVNTELKNKERENFLSQSYPYFIDDYKELSRYKGSRSVKFLNKFLRLKSSIIYFCKSLFAV